MVDPARDRICRCAEGQIGVRRELIPVNTVHTCCFSNEKVFWKLFSNPSFSDWLLLLAIINVSNWRTLTMAEQFLQFCRKTCRQKLIRSNLGVPSDLPLKWFYLLPKGLLWTFLKRQPPPPCPVPTYNYNKCPEKNPLIFDGLKRTACQTQVTKSFIYNAVPNWRPGGCAGCPSKWGWCEQQGPRWWGDGTDVRGGRTKAKE